MMRASRARASHLATPHLEQLRMQRVDLPAFEDERDRVGCVAISPLGDLLAVALRGGRLLIIDATDPAGGGGSGPVDADEHVRDVVRQVQHELCAGARDRKRHR